MLPGGKNLDAAIRRFNGGGGGASPRFFGMGAPSIAGVASGGGGNGNLKEILQNMAPLPAATPQTVAIDPDGDAMIVDLWGQGPTGTSFVEVAVSKGTGTDTGYSVVYEISMGARPPKLTFTPGVDALGGLKLDVTSDVALVSLRGRQMLI